MQTASIRPPLYASRVSAGFPSPVDDYIDKRLDLNDLLVQRPAATLFFWVRNDAMRPATMWHWGKQFRTRHQPDATGILNSMGLQFVSDR